jgi:hypothetical protein
MLHYRATRQGCNLRKLMKLFENLSLTNGVGKIK